MSFTASAAELNGCCVLTQTLRVTDYSFIKKSNKCTSHPIINNKITVALFITNYISMEKCYKDSRGNKAIAGWQQRKVNMFADELRGCHQQRCDQRRVAVCLSAGTCASLRGCFSAFAGLVLCVHFMEV